LTLGRSVKWLSNPFVAETKLRKIDVVGPYGGPTVRSFAALAGALLIAAIGVNDYPHCDAKQCRRFVKPLNR